MKRKEVQKQIMKVVDTIGRVDATIFADGKKIETKPILVGMVTGLLYGHELLSDDADDVTTDPGKVIKGGLMAACEALGFVKIDREDEEGGE